MSTRRQQHIAQAQVPVSADTQPFSSDLKQIGTIEIRFDKRSREALVREDALERYQENCYTLGRVFSNMPVTKQGPLAAENELRLGGDELLSRDLEQLRSELPAGELKDLLVESIADLQ